MSVNFGSTLGDLLKRVYDKGSITELENLTSPLLSMIGEGADGVLGGTGLFIPVNVEGDFSVGWINESQALRATQNEVVKQAQVTPKVLTGSVEITGLGAAMSSGNAASFANGLQYNIDMKMQRAMVLKEAALFRDGTGVLALINESSVPNTTTAVDVDTPGAHHLEVNMLVDILDGTTNVRKVTGAKILRVDRINDQVYFDTNFAAQIANNDKIVITDTQTSGSLAANEMLGLAAAVATSGTYLGIPRSDFPTWQSNVVDAGSTPVTEDILERALNQLEVVGGISSKQGMALVMHPDQRRKYLELVVPQKQFTGLSLDAGYQTLGYDGMPIVTSHKCPSTVIYIGNFNNLQRFAPPGGEMKLDDNGGGVIKWLTGYDKQYAFFREYSNWALRKPNSFVRIESLTGVASR